MARRRRRPAMRKPLLVDDPNRVVAIRSYWEGAGKDYDLKNGRACAVKALMARTPSMTEARAAELIEEALEIEIDERFIAGIFSDFIQDHSWAAKHSLQEVRSLLKD